MRTLRYIFAFVLIAGSLSACDWIGNDDEEEPHVRAEGLVLRTGGQEIVRYEDGEVTGAISVPVGEETDHINVYFLDIDGEIIDEAAFEEEHALGYTIANPNIAAFEQDEGEEWEFHIHGEAVGETTITLRIMHDDHPDFTSAAIPITVTEAPAQ